MKYLKYIIFTVTAMMLFSSSCASKKSIEDCKIDKVLKAIAASDELYHLQVKFSHCASIELRETLIKEEIRSRFPLLHDKTIYVEEYLGKMYNEYKYKIKVKVE